MGLNFKFTSRVSRTLIVPSSRQFCPPGLSFTSVQMIRGRQVVISPFFVLQRKLQCAMHHWYFNRYWLLLPSTVPDTFKPAVIPVWKSPFSRCIMQNWAKKEETPHPTVFQPNHSQPLPCLSLIKIHSWYSVVNPDRWPLKRKEANQELHCCDIWNVDPCRVRGKVKQISEFCYLLKKKTCHFCHPPSSSCPSLSVSGRLPQAAHYLIKQKCHKNNLKNPSACQILTQAPIEMPS